MKYEPELVNAGRGNEPARVAKVMAWVARRCRFMPLLAAKCDHELPARFAQ